MISPVSEEYKSGAHLCVFVYQPTSSSSSPMGTSAVLDKQKQNTHTHYPCLFYFPTRKHTRKDERILVACEMLAETERERGFSKFHTWQDSRHNRCFVLRTKVFSNHMCAQKIVDCVYFEWQKLLSEYWSLWAKDFEIVASSGFDNCVIIGSTKAIFKPIQSFDFSPHIYSQPYIADKLVSK